MITTWSNWYLLILAHYLISLFVCLFVTPSQSGTNALKFFIDNKYMIY